MSPSSNDIMFGPFPVTGQVFYKTKLTYALVNLMPIMPGHVLVCPRRIVPRYKDMTDEEIADHAITVQRVSRMVERVFDSSALNIAIQDGPAAGQTVRHVHTHIIPRKDSDLERTDDIYPMMEGEEGNIGEHLRQHRTKDKARTRGSVVIEDEDRKPRSQEEMHREARWLESEMEADLGRGFSESPKL